MAGFGVRAFQARMALSAAKERQITQADVGRALGVTGAAVSRWESGDKEPDLTMIEKLAKVLGVSAAYLAFGDEDTAAAATIDVAHDRKMTPADRERARADREKRGVAAKKSPTAKASTRRRA